jgi:hypothetical protein
MEYDLAPRPRVLRELPEADPTVLPGIDAAIIMPALTIRSGELIKADVQVRNTTQTVVAFDTGRPLSAFFVLPGTRLVVGEPGGPIDGTGLIVRLDPEGSALLPTLVAARGHGSIQQRSGRHLYLQSDLQPGTYGLVAPVPVYRLDQPTDRLKEFWSQELLVSVTAADK